jgi:hypothetical protein
VTLICRLVGTVLYRIVGPASGPHDGKVVLKSEPFAIWLFVDDQCWEIHVQCLAVK